MNFKSIILLMMVITLAACQQDQPDTKTVDGNVSDKYFTAIPASHSGVDFVNEMDVNKVMSPLQYINVFNGGGVAVGDVDNDGLVDVFFTGNISDNKLYRNKGDFQFEDITSKAGVASTGSWCTGACMVDINKDGWLDIYVCRSYYEDPAKRENQLFINNGDLSFTEQGAKYGVNDNGYSIMAAFFDYDKNGTLDVFVGNHPKDRFLSYAELSKNWENPNPVSSNHLYKNNGNGQFTDVTVQSGVLSYGWTLGMVTVDLNQDDWPDIYVTVDHTEPDRLYINNKNGTFTESSRSSLKHMSQSTMGIDAGDINNDGLPDLVTVEMLAADNYRAKTQMQSMDVKRFWNFVIAGYNYQYMRNMLHVNNGNGTFREVGQLSEIHKTDWSWASLFMDIDHDGWQDLFVCNGYYRDYSDQDYRIGYNDQLIKADDSGNNNEKIRLMTNHAKDAKSTKLKNYLFKNNGDYTFDKFSAEAGLDFKGFSNGAAYADLDKDGDLDLIVNNINDKALIYSGNATSMPDKNNWLRVNLEAKPYGHNIGTKLWLETDGGDYYQEHVLTRGYQSTMEDMVHFGLGKSKKINRLEVQWPDGKRQVLKDVATNQFLKLEYKNANLQPAAKENKPTLFADVTQASELQFNHREAYYDDYAVQVLLPHQMSCFGPALDVADINKDGLEDVFIGGAQNQAGAIFIQNANGTFSQKASSFLEADKQQEDLGAAFFDADSDGDLDLYVASGGNEKPEGDVYYSDRLYLNDGSGQFSKSTGRIPDIRSSGSCVRPFDYDKDGDLDLFVGSRHIPGKYPFAPGSYLLQNDGGQFKDVTKEKASALLDIGMVTDAMWTDLNNDGQVDLFLVGEWMPLTFLIQEKGVYNNATIEYDLAETRGWWNTINKVDVDGDGDDDYVLGNLGLNYKYKVKPGKPFHVYADDFDKSGSNDIVLGYENDQNLFPVRGKQCSSEQLPNLAQKFPTYDAFGKASLTEIYGDKLENALHYTINTFESSILFNSGNGQYELKALPKPAQASPVNGILSKDFDKDGHVDLLMAGNLHVSEVETGRADAGIGYFLKGDGKGNFKTIFAPETGFFAWGDVKHLRFVKGPDGAQRVIIAKNNTLIQVVQ